MTKRREGFKKIIPPRVSFLLPGTSEKALPFDDANFKNPR